MAHGKNLAVVGENNYGSLVPETDGLLTNKKNTYLAITVADCLPIFIFDPVKKVISLVHAGWRGVAGKIAHAAVELMKKNYGSQASDILAGIGPHICPGHYEVKGDVAEKFTGYGDRVCIAHEGKTYLNMAKAVKIQLFGCGLTEENIEVSPECTYEHPDKYFSFRRDRPKHLETMLAVFGLTA